MSLYSEKSATSGAPPSAMVQEKVRQLEKALQDIGAAKKQLFRNTTEAKSRIQCNISRQLEALRNREVWLLNQLDIVSSAKEEVLQQQSAKLNQTLGVLQSSLAFPGDNRTFPSIDLGNIRPEETPYICFKADSADLRSAITNYGTIDSSSVPPLKSPFMAPDHPAPSLPRNFEDYDDAEHHVLYKTVEEINRARTEQSCVMVTIPKLSSRIEDWLVQSQAATTTTSSITKPKFSFPKLSDNVNDWLKNPSAPVTGQSLLARDARQETREETVMRETTDASIKTWLHKIKQNPFEEEEDDFEFIEEMSGTGTQASVETLESFPEPVGADGAGSLADWLYCGSKVDTMTLPVFKVQDMPLDKWLQKATKKVDCTTTNCRYVIDMSRYLNKVTDELDKWLAIGSLRTQQQTEDLEVAEPARVPVVPPTLTLHSSFTSSLSQGGNPWLLKSRSVSPASSCRSSSAGRTSQATGANKWLLPGHQDAPPSATLSCPFFEKYLSQTQSLCWLKEKNKPEEVQARGFSFLLEPSDHTNWLKAPSSTAAMPTSQRYSISSGFDKLNKKPQEYWLHPKVPCPASRPMSGSFSSGRSSPMPAEPSEGKWLMRTNLIPNPAVLDIDLEEL